MVVLAGAAGSGKSTWAADHYRTAEIVSSDALRAVVGSGPADLDATTEAFDLLDQIVAARTRRGLTTVIDTLGLDPDRRRDYLGRPGPPGCRRAGGVDTPAALCRRRNRDRDRPVPAPVITEQLRRVRRLRPRSRRRPGTGVSSRWRMRPEPSKGATGGARLRQLRAQPGSAPTGAARSVMLQVSRFPWAEEDPTAWLVDLARAADAYGFAGLALMDHLIQIPQVDRAWEPIPEPWVTLGLLAGLDTRLRLGTLVSPVTFRPRASSPRPRPPWTC